MFESLRRLFRGSAIRESAGKLTREIALLGQQRAERGLRESEEHFGRLVAGVRDYAIFLLDPAGNVVTWNAGAERIKGYRAEEIIGQHFSRFYPKDAVASGWPAHELSVAAHDGPVRGRGLAGPQGRLPVLGQRRHHRPAGRVGRGPGLLEDHPDLTDRKQAEEKLRLSEERFRLLVEGVQDYAIFMLDPEGHVATWNAGAERIKGYTAEEIIGQHFSRFYPQEAIERGWPARGAAARDSRGPVRGRGLAGPQGRLAVLGQRRHHRAAGRGRRPAGLRQGHAGLDRAQAGRGERPPLAPRRSGAQGVRRGRARDSAAAGAVARHARQHRRCGDRHRPARRRHISEPGRRGADRLGTEQAAANPWSGSSASSTRRRGSRSRIPSIGSFKEGVIVGLANHTVLIAKDGREIPIDDSGAPIRGRG